MSKDSSSKVLSQSAEGLYEQPNDVANSSNLSNSSAGLSSLSMEMRIHIHGRCCPYVVDLRVRCWCRMPSALLLHCEHVLVGLLLASGLSACSSVSDLHMQQQHCSLSTHLLLRPSPHMPPHAYQHSVDEAHHQRGMDLCIHLCTSAHLHINRGPHTSYASNNPEQHHSPSFRSGSVHAVRAGNGSRTINLSLLPFPV